MKSLLRPLLLGIALVLAAFSSPAANRTWDGGDLDLPTFWSARTNWNGNTNITTGDALFFPGTAAVKTMDNNLSISNFAKLTFNDDAYILNGNSLRLTNGITANYVPTGPTRINVGIMLGDDAAFEADDSSATLELNGPVNMLGFILTNQGVGNITWLAPFRSSTGGILRKRETGTVTVRSTNANFLGTVEISGGDFNVNGRMTAGAISVLNNGTLGGTGLVHAVTVNSGGILAPGGAARGVLTVTNGLTLQARSILEADILSSTTGTFDQLNVLGVVSLTNAALNLTVNFVPVSPTAITIIANDGAEAVLGTFSGLPQGATVLVTDFIRATISYTGGTGNDVVITVSPLETLTWTGSANGLWSEDANWVGGAAPQPGDSLVFPVVAVRKIATNDFPADTVFGLMRLEANYVLLGARAAVRRGVHGFHTGGSPSVLLPLLLEASQTFTNQFADIDFTGSIDLGGFVLSFLNANSGVGVTVNGSIHGVGAVTVDGPGQVSLDSSNSFTGVLDAGGRVLVRHPAALGTVAQATLVRTNVELLVSSVPANSVISEPLNLSGTLSSAAANLTWAGNVTFGSPQARVFVTTGQTLSFTSATLGTNGFIKDGPGTLRLATIQASHGGTTLVKAGTLQVDTAMTNSALVVSNGATLTGTGTVRQATFLAGSTLSPAGEVGGDLTVSTLVVTQSLTLQGSARLRVNLDGPTVQRYDQVDVLGTVNLGAGTAILEVDLRFIPTEGNSFAILDNDGADAINGNFAGKPQGAIFTANGQRLQISYTAGSGNDIVLTVLGPEELTWTGAGGNGNWSTPGNWSPARTPQDGDRLVFPGGTPRRFVTNDMVAPDLHSLRFAGGGASNNNFQVAGSTVVVSSGIVVSNPVSAQFLAPVFFATEQTLIVQGLLAFENTLQMGGDVTVNASATLRAENLFGPGQLRGTGGTWDIAGDNIQNGGYAASNVFLNYSARQSNGDGTFLTNGTFRLNAEFASIRDLLLSSSVLDLVGASIHTPDILLVCHGDLTFLGASRLDFAYHASRRPLVEATGDVRLNNAALVVGEITAALGVPITVIRNRGTNPVAGIFNGLPEGAGFLAANGTRLVISYSGGGGGRDVTLTPISPATGVTRVWRGLAANGDWNQPGNWIGNLVPGDGDSVEFPDAPKPINTNNLPAVRYNQLRFTGTSGVARVLAPNTNSFVGLQLFGGLDYRDTGTLRIPVTNAGFLNPRGLVQILAPQDFHVATGGTVKVDALIGLPGAAITKTGGGILEVSASGGFFGAVAVPLRVREGTLRVGTMTESLEQTGGTLDVLQAAQDITLFGGAFQTAPIATNDGVRVAHLDAGGATNLVVFHPGGEGAAGRLTVTNSLILNSNVTLRMDIANTVSLLGISGSADDLIDLGDSGDFHFNDARLELNFQPGFNPSPTNFVLLTISQNARTNLGTFAGLPHLGLLTNEFGLFRIYYRDFVLPPPFNIFGNATNHDSVILERIAARPVMLAVANGPGAFKTITALGTPGALYVIEVSEDLENWTAIGAETASPLTGLFNFTDVSLFDHRFYRARLP